MRKKAALLFILTVFIISVCGCETIKGAFKGGAEGASRDWQTAKGAGSALMRADEWTKKNLW